LTTAEGLVLPKSIGGWLWLNGLSNKERKEIRNKGYKVF